MKSLKTYIVCVAVLLIVYLVAQYNRPNAVNWSETYNSNDKIPFGTYVIFHRIGDIFPGSRVETFHEPVYNVINDHGIRHGTYLIICNDVNFNEFDFQKLKGFIKAGNNVLISASYFGDQLKKELNIETATQLNNIKDAGGVKFINPSLDTNKIYSVGKGIGGVYFTQMDTSKAIVLGTDQTHHINYLKYSFGKGSLYLNANPLMFTNYSVFNKSSEQYAAIALSFVKADNYIIWDQYYATGREDDGSSMRVFLRNAMLRWAFYIAFFSLIAFVLFDIKRRQRIIPIIEPLKNSTLDFVTVVGQVYYEKRNNANIAQKKILYLLANLRDEYHVQINKIDQDFKDKLVSKLNIEPSFAGELVSYFQYINNQNSVSDSELIELNKLIEKFYKQSR
jgi:hypothetical protein